MRNLFLQSLLLPTYNYKIKISIFAPLNLKIGLAYYSRLGVHMKGYLKILLITIVLAFLINSTVLNYLLYKKFSQGSIGYSESLQKLNNKDNNILQIPSIVNYNKGSEEYKDKKYTGKAVLISTSKEANEKNSDRDNKKSNKKRSEKLNKATAQYLENRGNEANNYIVKSGNSVETITATLSEISEILDNSEIENIELDQEISLLGDTISENIIKIKADQLWAYTKGNGVKIAILDSGISPHEDLKIAGGVSFVSEAYGDTLGHGTQVAGAVSALLNGQGIVGAAPEADIYSVKISDGKEGNLSSAAKGLKWAIDNNMSIVVMSFGFLVYSQIFKDLVEEAYSNGIILVSAEGNDGIAEAQYPARYERVIAVGSIGSDNVKAPFSNYGPDLEFVAPGTNINTTTIGNGYAIAEGTSYSAAYVAGVAALIKAYNKSLTNIEIRDKLRNDALNLGDNGWDSLYGYGMIQANLDTFNFTPHNDSYFYQVYILP